MNKNTARLWDSVWASSLSDFTHELVKEENSIRWQRMEKRVVTHFGSFKNLNVIEIGAGRGIYSVLMAKRGAKVMILDYSDLALKKSSEFFRKNKLKAKFVKQNALDMPKTYNSRYDISMSFGLAEHFKGANRRKIVKTHFDVIKNNGITFIAVPNRYCPPYRIYKFLSQITKRWAWGEEYPFSRRELGNICYQIGIGRFSFFGGSMTDSLNFINPLRILRRVFKVPDKDISKIRKEWGTIFDQYLSYSLTLYGKNG